MEKQLKIEILKIIKENYNLDLSDINLSTPPKKEMGDLAFNAGILSRELKKSPIIIADELISHLEKIKLIKEVKSDSGFVNIKLNDSIFTEIFIDIEKKYLFDKSYFNIGDGSKLVVDYIGANVGKPLHIGHMCTPNQGQAMINTYKKLGYDLISDSHIGDWGIIFGKLIFAYKLWGNEEKLKENAVDYLLELYVKITAEIEKDITVYKNRYLELSKLDEYNINTYFNDNNINDKNYIKIRSNQEKLIFTLEDLNGQRRLGEIFNNKPDIDLFKWIENKVIELNKKILEEGEFKNFEGQTRDEFKLLSTGNKESIELWKKFTSYSIEAMNKNLARLNVFPDYNIGESFYEGLGLPKLEDNPDLEFDMYSVVEELISKGIATKNDDNSVGVIFENDKLPSCILQKRDGTHGYLASDLASIKYRTTNWNPAKIVYFVDVRQQLHFKQAFEIAKNAGWLNDTELFHAYNGFISGKEGAFSTRKGNIIKLSDLLDEAESRAKNIILEKRSDLSEVELDNISKIVGIGAIKYGYLKKNRETDVIFDWDEFMTFEGNSGPYIQYAYVRAIRILENSLETDFSKEIKVNFEYSEEFDLIKILSNYKDVLIEATNKNAPHILCKYAYDLTKSFNSFYNSVHILNEENSEKKYARLKLLNLFSITLKETFSLLAIDMPNKM